MSDLPPAIRRVRNKGPGNAAKSGGKAPEFEENVQKESFLTPLALHRRAEHTAKNGKGDEYLDPQQRVERGRQKRRGCLMNYNY